jgi:undecaprenyl phosphate-alpha-L-ara4N flippase subunit ArnE
VNAALVPAALGLLAFCIAAETVQQLSFKGGANRAGAAVGFIQGVLRQPLVWAGVAIWAVESVAWVLVLEKTPLSLAYPVMTLSYAAVPLAGVLVLKERVSRRQLAGAALIFLGVACVGLSGLPA